MNKSYINNPQEIEKRSFEIISEELGANVPPESIRDIVLRVIHTTADFEYADLIEFKNDAVEKALRALSSGCRIYTDTQMLAMGINRNALGLAGCSVVNFVHDDDVCKAAKERSVTRSTAAIEKALGDPEVKIFAIGNAPTALYTLIEAIEQGAAAPDLIIGAPIGFVGAAESKEALDRLDHMGIGYIRINGRKGGSPVAATILNALLYRLGRKW